MPIAMKVAAIQHDISWEHAEERPTSDDDALDEQGNAEHQEDECECALCSQHQLGAGSAPTITRQCAFRST